MAEIIFDLQLFDGPGGGGTPPDGEGGGTPPGGGSSSSSVSWSGATSITSSGTYSNQTYTSTSADQNAVLISTTGKVNLSNVTVTKSGGTSASDNYSFYGINSAVMCMGGGTTSISGGTVTTSAAGANGIFSYGANNGTTNATGDGTTVYVKNVTINTTAQGSGGIMTTYGGTTVAENLTITTSGGSSAPIRTDRGGGWVTVNGGSYTSSGLGSPAIYSTADVKVNDATLNSELSEGVCIEGTGSIALSNCTLTANNTSTNGNATFLDTIMIYQSQSGDASDGTSQFTMTGGTLNSKSGHVFHVTNTSAIITLENVTINNTDSENILLSVCDDGWSGASNIATLNASNQTLEGDILVGDDSTLTLTLEDSSSFTGNISGNISNNAGTSVSTSIGTVNVTLDDSSKWYLTGDTYISSFSGTASNVITGEYTLYVNNVALDGTSTSDDGGEDENSTLISGTSSADSIYNSESSVMISTSGGADTVNNTGANVTIDAGSGNNLIMNDSASANNVSIVTGSGNDIISNMGSYVTIQSAGGNNILTNSSNSYANISLGAGADSIYNILGSNATINAGNGNNLILNSGENVIISAGSGADSIANVETNINISAGLGNDSIANTGDSVTVDTGAGNDSVTVGSSYVSIYGGAGNDYISLLSAAENITILASTGKDSIEGVNSTTYLQGTFTGSSVSGDNVILTSSNGTLTVVDGAGETLNINGEESVIGGEEEMETLISGTSGADNISNTLSGVMISTGGGADTITNTGDSVTIDSGAGNDIISNSGDNVSIYGNAGADSIKNTCANVTISGGAGNDSITALESENVSINAGGGNNYIFNGYVYYDDDNNFVDHETLAANASSTILAGSGKDTIVNQGIYNASVDAGNGSNSILIYHSYNSTLITGSGADLIDVARGGSLGVYSGAGNDSIIGHLATIQTNDFDNWAFGSYATIDAGAGNDYISLHYSGNSSIFGGAGNDTIINNGENTTINGGAGNDYIEFTNNLREDTGDYEAAVFVASAGNDTIKNYSSVVTLQGTFTSSSVSGDNVILTSSNGTLTILDGAGETLNINGVESVISADNETIGAAFAEFMLKRTEKGYPALCDSGLFEPDTKGFDAPDAYLTENWTIESADHLKLCGTHYGPKNPTGQWVVLVTGYGQVGATMNIHAAALLAMDYDVLVVEPRASGNSEGEWLTMGVAECVDVALWTQKIAETNSNAQITLFGISMGAATVIMAAALSQTTNVTSLIEDCGYANIYSIFANLAPHFAESFGWTGTTEELFDKVADASESLTGYNVADAVPLDSIGEVTVPSMFIHGTADTIVPVEDVQKLYDASGATIKELWTVEGGVHGKSVLEDPFSYLAKAATLLGAANEEIGASIKNSTAEKLIRGTIYDDTIKSSAKNVTIEAVAGDDYISLSSAAKNNTIYAGEGNDSIIGGGGNNLFVYAGGNDYIGGYKTTDTIQISSGAITKDTVSGSNVIFTVGEDNITLKGAKNKTIHLIDADGNSFSTIISGIYTEVTITDSDKSSVKVDTNALLIDASSRTEDLKITGNSKANTILGGSGVDTIYGGSGNDSIFGNDGADKLYGDAGNDSLYGGADDDYINGGAGNDRLYGEAGADSILGASGNDYIEGGAGADSLYGDAGNDSIYGGADADYINGGAGNDRLYGEDGADSILGGAGTDYIEGGAGADSLYGDAGNDSIYGGADADYIDGGAGNDKLFGEAGADIILGGEGNDTLNGGDGNDTLTGGNGNDIFVFEGGNDVITDYTASKDKIKLSAEITNTTYDGDDVIFTLNEGTLTVKDGNGKKISIINSSGKTTTQLYSNANTRTLDLFEDNNFMTDDLNLSDITEAKYSVTDIQDNNSDTFAQDKNILTFAKEK